jgi:hypothetical protein
MLQRLKARAGMLKRDTIALYLAARDPRTPWYAKLLRPRLQEAVSRGSVRLSQRLSVTQAPGHPQWHMLTWHPLLPPTIQLATR